MSVRCTGQRSAICRSPLLLLLVEVASEHQLKGDGRDLPLWRLPVEPCFDVHMHTLVLDVGSRAGRADLSTLSATAGAHPAARLRGPRPHSAAG